jgi:hypothetical protein
LKGNNKECWEGVFILVSVFKYFQREMEESEGPIAGVGWVFFSFVSRIEKLLEKVSTKEKMEKRKRRNRFFSQGFVKLVPWRNRTRQRDERDGRDPTLRRRLQSDLCNYFRRKTSQKNIFSFLGDSILDIV